MIDSTKIRSEAFVADQAGIDYQTVLVDGKQNIEEQCKTISTYFELDAA